MRFVVVQYPLELPAMHVPLVLVLENSQQLQKALFLNIFVVVLIQIERIVLCVRNHVIMIHP